MGLVTALGNGPMDASVSILSAGNLESKQMPQTLESSEPTATKGSIPVQPLDHQHLPATCSRYIFDGRDNLRRFRLGKASLKYDRHGSVMIEFAGGRS